MENNETKVTDAEIVADVKAEQALEEKIVEETAEETKELAPAEDQVVAPEADVASSEEEVKSE